MHIVITHTDADGWVCGRLVNDYLEHNCPREPIYNFTWNYGQSCSIIARTIEGCIDARGEASSEFNNKVNNDVTKDVSNNLHIWMTDITLPDEFMEKYACYIHHFDHHESRIKNPASWTDKLLQNCSAITLEGYKDLSGKQAKQVAACELVWEKLINTENRWQMPDIVRYAGRYDVWDNNDDTFALHAYLVRLKVFDSDLKYTPYLDISFKNLFSDDGFVKALKEGRELLYYEKLFNAENSVKIAKVEKIKGRKIIVGNPGKVNSTFYDKVVEQNPDVEGILTFYYNVQDNDWIVSCYSVSKNFVALDFLTDLVKDIKVRSIGGHANACGCVLGNSAISDFMDAIYWK